MSAYPVFTKSAPQTYISLSAARADPRIVYHSVRHLESLPPVSRPIPSCAPPALLEPAISVRRAHAAARAAHERLPAMLFSRPRRAQPQPSAVPRGFSLIPLSVAASRSDIKYRREGFEMQEHRQHLLAVRSDLF